MSVVANGGRRQDGVRRSLTFEEVAPLHGTGKHLHEADFHLLECESVGVAGGSIDGGQRSREPGRPAIEEGLHVSGAELIADRLQAPGVATREEPIVETVKGDVGAPQLLLDPLVAIETQLDRIRDIGPELQERRAPLRVLHVEVVMIDRDGLPREVERDADIDVGANAFIPSETALQTGAALFYPTV